MPPPITAANNNGRSNRLTAGEPMEADGKFKSVWFLRPRSLDN